jgi:hypothetical protein
MLNFSAWVNLAASAGLNDFSAGTLYNEKEQSTNSIATDVERDFNGRAKEFCGSIGPCDRDALRLTQTANC